MGPETTAVLDERATALRQRLFRARETTYRIDDTTNFSLDGRGHGHVTHPRVMHPEYFWSG